MSKIKWTQELRKTKDLQENPKNPRRISKKSYQSLKDSLKKFGQVEPLICQPDGLLIGGHQRLKILKLIGYHEVLVWVPDRTLTEREVDELSIRMNKNSGEWDDDLLAAFFEPSDLLEWGFSASELELSGEDSENIQTKFTLTATCSSSEERDAVNAHLEHIKSLFPAVVWKEAKK